MPSIISDNSVSAALPSGWSRLPAEYAIPTQPPSLIEAQQYCQRLARSHYENFSVASWFSPRRQRQHFFNVYAYCRISDDLGDEVGDTQASLRLLAEWEAELDACYSGSPRHPVFVALAETVRKFAIPKKPFADLLTAFRQDQSTVRYPAFADVLGYCRYSANPVGRLVLYLCGYRDSERQRLSDVTCTALQLANFWQDVSRDLDKGRIYIPVDALERHGLQPSDIEARRFDKRYQELMRDLIARTRQLFAEGRPLASMLARRLSIDIELFSRGGLAVLNAIESSDYNTLAARPSIGGPQRLLLFGRTLASRMLPALTSGKRVKLATTETAANVGAGPVNDGTAVERSYEHCREVARKAASNFYYA